VIAEIYTVGIFYATVILAIITLGLVIATFRLVRRTVDGSRLLDKHHQESLAPFLIFDNLHVIPRSSSRRADRSAPPYLLEQQFTIWGTLRNIGGGPAAQIKFMLDYSGHILHEPKSVLNAIGAQSQLDIIVDVYLPVYQPLGTEEIAAYIPSYELIVSYNSVFNTTRTTKYNKNRNDPEISEETSPVIIDTRLKSRIRRVLEWPR